MVSFWTVNGMLAVMDIVETARRRRFSVAEKIRIVEESHHEGMRLADVARRHEISRSMLYDWRYRHKLGLLGAPMPFMRLVPMGCGPQTDDVLSSTTPPPPAMTIDLGERYRVTIPVGFDMEAAARLLNGLVVSK
jgi:transposase